MNANLTNIRLGKTMRGYPKVTFTVTLGELDDAGEFVPKFESEAWSLYKRQGAKGEPDARGVPGTSLRLPMVPLLYKVPGTGGLYRRAQFITAQACEEGLLEAIHAAIISQPRVKKYMGLVKESDELIKREDIGETGAFRG